MKYMKPDEDILRVVDKETGEVTFPGEVEVEFVDASGKSKVRMCQVRVLDGIPLVVDPDQPTHTIDGLQIPDQRPVEVPLGFERPENLMSMMQRMVQNELSRRADAAGGETFEEANDLDVDDDDELVIGPAQLAEMQASELHGLKAMLDREEARRADAQASGGAVRAQQDALPLDGGSDLVRESGGREDVRPGNDAGGGAPPVRPVEQPAASGKK